MSNFKLNDWTANKIAAGKKLTKHDMAWELGRHMITEHYDIFQDHYKRDEIRLAFNKNFNTNIQ